MWNICGVVSKLNSNRKQDPGQSGYWKHQILLIYGIFTNIYRYRGKYVDVNSCTGSSSKSFNFWFSAKFYLISKNEEHLLDKTVHWFYMGPPWAQSVPKFIEGNFFVNFKERKVTWRPMHCSMRVHGVCVYVPKIVCIFMDLEWLEFLKALH